MKPKNSLNEMEKLAKDIKKIQFISNTILANACYHNKEMESQIAMAEKHGQLDANEKQVICDAWNIRNKYARQLLIDLQNFIEQYLRKTEL